MASAKLGMKWRQKNVHPYTDAPIEEFGIVERAMRACHVNDLDNRRVFSSIMIYKDPMSCEEVVNAFESECRNGENKKIKKSLAAILTHRLKQIADIVKK